MTCFGRVAELTRLQGLLGDDPVAVLIGLPGLGKTELVYRVEAELLAAAPRPVTHVNVGPEHQGKLHGYLLERLTGQAQDPALSPLVDLLVREPHVLVIDDAQHAAAEVAVLIDRLMRRIGVASRLVVASRVMLPIETTPIVVRLEPLTPEDSHSLLHHLATRLGVHLDDISALVSRGGGSPLLLRQIVAGHGRGERSHDPLRGMIAALGEPASYALTQLAAMSTCSQSRRAAERLVPSDDILQSLHEQCLVELGPERVVVHSLVRDAVLAKADPELVLESRKQAAEALWQEYEACRRPAVAIEAICLAASAGEFDAAMAQLQTASRAITDAGLDHLILPMLEKLAAQGSLDATLLAARIYVRTARIRDATRMMDLVRPNDRTLHRALVLRATLDERRGDLAAATRGFTTALEHTPPGSPRRWLGLRLAVLLALAGRADAADRALAELEQEILGGSESSPESSRDAARYWWSQTLTRLARYEWDEALAAILEGLRIAGNVGDRELVFLFRLAGLLATSELGHVEQTREWADELTSAQRGEPIHSRLIDLFLGVVRFADGRLDEAVAHLRRAHEIHERDQDVLLATLAAHYLARAMLTEGSAAAACEVLRGIVESVLRHGMGALAGPTQALLGRALIAAGRMSDARTLARELLGHHLPTIVGEAHTLLAYAAAYGGDIAEARQHVARALATVGERAAARSGVMLDQATLELLGGDPERARAAALAVRDTEAHQARPLVRGRVLYVLAVADLAAGLIDTALEALAEADLIASTFGLGQLGEAIKLLRSATALGESIFDRIPTEHRAGYMGLLRVLGMRSGTLVVSSRHGRIHIDGSQLPRVAQHLDIVVDRVNSSIRGPSLTVEGRATAVSILVGLAESDEPVTPERLYQIVWGGSEYHPLRHRNTLYIALNRTRKLLKDVGESREVILRGSIGWSISPEIDLAIVRRDPRVSTVAATL